MKQILSIQDQLALMQLDRMAVQVLGLIDSHKHIEQPQLDLQAAIGQMRSAIIECGCKRPSSCGSCRSKVEDEVYWSEKIDDILDEAKREAQDERDFNTGERDID